MFTELFPVVVTPDVPRALRFYRDALRGTVTHEFSDADGDPVYVGVDIGSTHMGIGLEAGIDSAAPRSIRIWIHAEDCDAAVERLRALDVRVIGEPQDQPSGDRVARILDPDGNEITIGQRGGGRQQMPGGMGARLVSPEPERYTRPEFERRFLVSPDSSWREVVEPYSKSFDDLYIRHTRLRLRTLSDSASGREFIKLTKKLESTSPYLQLIGSIPLSPMEYDFLAALEGDRIRKVRHYHLHRGHVFSIDVFQDDLSGLVMCEVEAGSIEELMRLEPPDFAMLEVTEDPFFTGGRLCRASRDDLKTKMAALGIPLRDLPSDG